MILEVARALTDWFNDPVEGIAAKLVDIPREDGDAVPALGTIADLTRHNLVAQQRFATIPGIAVNVRQVPLLDGQNNTVTGDGIADVLVRIARSDQDTQQALTDTSYILRALLRSWRGFNRDTRTRNQVQIYHCDNLIIAPDWTPVDTAIVTGAASALLQFRDLLAV
jgi:hypothetical protein